MKCCATQRSMLWFKKMHLLSMILDVWSFSPLLLPILLLLIMFIILPSEYKLIIMLSLCGNHHIILWIIPPSEANDASRWTGWTAAWWPCSPKRPVVAKRFGNNGETGGGTHPWYPVPRAVTCFCFLMSFGGKKVLQFWKKWNGLGHVCIIQSLWSVVKTFGSDLA